MGFLSFFSRKSSSSQLSKVSSRGVKAQPYEATTASDAPFQGTYPVAGNGPNVLNTLSKSARFRHTQSASKIDLVAPPPTVPLHSEASRGSRADVAANEPAQPIPAPPPAPASKRRNSFRAPPLSFRKPRGQPSVSSSLGETPEFALYGAGFTQVFPPSHSAASHRRESLVLNDAGKSVDVLDAHSEISPLDFRNRVQATGVKDYGEDVADRNLLKTLYSLDPSQVQAFYGSLPKGKNPTSNRDLPLTAVRRARAQTDASPPSQATRAPLFSLFPDRAASEIGFARGHDRKASIKTYVPTGSTGSFSSNMSAKLRPHSMHRSAMPAELQRPATTGSGLPARPVTSWGDSGTGEDVPPLPHYVPKRLEDVAGKGSRLPVAVPKPGMPVNQFLFRFPPATHQPSSSSRPGTASNRGSVPSSALPSAPAQPSSPGAKRTRHALQPSALSSSDSGGSGELAGADSAPSPCVKFPATRSDIRGPAEPRRGHVASRSRSMTLPKVSQLEEIYEQVPEHVGSPRNWSLTSATRSLSSLSSNPFGNRPQSRHTSDTSIDLSFHTANALSTVSLPLSARGSIYATDSQGKLQLIPDYAPPIPDRGQLGHLFNIDDHVSSDDDSFIAAPSSQKGAANEDHLLFRESGYGFSELPGLHDLLHVAAPAPPAVLRPPPRSDKRPATSAGALLQHHGSRRSRHESPPRGHRYMASVASIFSTPSRGRSRRRRQSTAAAESAFLDQQEQAAWAQSPPPATYRGDGGGMISRTSHHGRKGSKRLSAFGSAYHAGGYDSDDEYYAPAPEVPISVRSAKSAKTATPLTEPAPAVPDRRNSDYAATLDNGSSSIYNCKHGQPSNDQFPTTKVDIAAAVRFRKLDKARRRTMEMATHRGDRVALAAATSAHGIRKSMISIGTAHS